MRTHRLLPGRLQGDRRAAAGFFEDLPALVVVVVATSLFLGFVIGTYRTYLREEAHSSFTENVRSFARKARSCPVWLHDGVPGLFDAHAMVETSLWNLSRELRFPDYSVRITISDLADYPVHYNASLERLVKGPDAKLRYGTVVLVLPVALWVTDDEVHAGRMTVEGWD